MTRLREMAWAASGGRSALWGRALRMGIALRKSAALRAVLWELQVDPDWLLRQRPETQAGMLALIEEGMRERRLAAEANCQFVDFVRHLSAQDQREAAREDPNAVPCLQSFSRPNAIARRKRETVERVLEVLRWISDGVSPWALRGSRLNDNGAEAKGSG